MKVVEGSQATGRRPQSPVTHAVESQFRKMMQGLTSSIDAASASLKQTLGEVLQRLHTDLGDSDGRTVGELQVCVAVASSAVNAALIAQ